METSKYFASAPALVLHRLARQQPPLRLLGAGLADLQRRVRGTSGEDLWKTIGKLWFNGILWDFAIENGRRNSGFVHETWKVHRKWP